MDLADLCRLFIAVNKCYTLDDFLWLDLYKSGFDEVSNYGCVQFY